MASDWTYHVRILTIYLFSMVCFVLITFIINNGYILCFCFSLSFLLEFNLYSWWNIDLSVKGNHHLMIIIGIWVYKRGECFRQYECEKMKTRCLTLVPVFLVQLRDLGLKPWWCPVTQNTLHLCPNAPSKKQQETLSAMTASGTAVQTVCESWNNNPSWS